VDSAICMPIFIIALAILLSLIAQVGIEESITYGMVKSAFSAINLYSAQDVILKQENAEEQIFAKSILCWQLAWNNFLKDEEEGGLKGYVKNSLLLPYSYQKKADNVLYVRVNLTLPLSKAMAFCKL